MQIRNRTSLAAAGIMDLDGEARERWLIAVKARFRLAAGEQPQPLAATVERVERFDGEGSLVSPSDFRPERVGTDLLLHGTAVSPDPRATSFVASVEIADRRVALRASGPRVWTRHGEEIRAGEPGPASSVPLLAARAFGGAPDPRNRAGLGVPEEPGTDPVGSPLPQIEWADDLVTGPSSRPSPALVAGLPCHAEERRRYAGTYDADWVRRRAPLPARDRDPRFFRVAPERLSFAPALPLAEPVVLENLGQPGRRTLVLPRLAPRLLFEREWIAMNLDLVVLDVDDSTVAMTYGASIDIAGRLDDRLVVDVSERRVLPLGSRASA